MYPYYRGYIEDYELHTDDVMGIQALYGMYLSAPPPPLRGFLGSFPITCDTPYLGKTDGPFHRLFRHYTALYGKLCQLTPYLRTILLGNALSLLLLLTPPPPSFFFFSSIPFFSFHRAREICLYKYPVFLYFSGVFFFFF